MRSDTNKIQSSMMLHFQWISQNVSKGKCKIMQDKVDGNGAESQINNNWENWQKWTSKIGGFMGWWPFSTIEYIDDSNVFFIEMQCFTLLDEMISIL